MINRRFLYEIFCPVCGRSILINPKLILYKTRDEVKEIKCVRCIKLESQIPFDFEVRVR